MSTISRILQIIELMSSVIVKDDFPSDEISSVNHVNKILVSPDTSRNCEKDY